MTTDVISRGPRDYVEVPFALASDAAIMDIGPGSYPFYRATCFVDHDRGILERAEKEIPGANTLHVNDLSDIPADDKSFDYVWCSHVLEHVNDPKAAVAEMSRIGKCGTIVVPSAIKEALFNFEEIEHKWLILPHPSVDMLIFIRHHRQYIDRIKDIDAAQKPLCRLLRTGPGHECGDSNLLRDWFWRKEKDLDIIYHWEGMAEILVLQ